MPKTLDFDAEQKVEYCIPLWARDLQIQASIARVKGRIDAGALRDGPIACVSYGPSLAQTWKSIRKFTHVMTCSGAHKFLVERGIIPTWHIEVDPRPHKVGLIGPPCQETTYLIASTCHQAVFDHLEGYRVKLWHVFDGSDDGVRTLPPGEWAITGGSSVGLRTMTLARFLGFRHLHVFGMDGCEGPTGKHAAAHPNQPKDYVETEYDGVTYRTTSSMLVCAKGTWHELDQLPDVTAKFYGEGLVQHMAKSYVRKPVKSSPMGFVRPELISEEYRALNAKLHQESMVYGVGGEKHADVVKKLHETIKPISVLDYGCGKGLLAKALPFPIWEYDPAIPLKAEPPRPAELVISTDVLEHVEPEHLEAVLMDLHRVTRKVGYFVIATFAANKNLPDGRNTHLIQEQEPFWRARLEKYFTVASMQKKRGLLHVVVGPKTNKKVSVRQSVKAAHVVEEAHA